MRQCREAVRKIMEYKNHGRVGLLDMATACIILYIYTLAADQLC